MPTTHLNNTFIENLEKMRTLKKSVKVVSWLLTVLMLFQSCVIYHKTPSSLEQASQFRTKTKITNSNKDIFKYKYITYEDGMFYGVKKKSGELVKTPLDEEYIITVLSKNKSASTWLTVAIIAIPVTIIIIGLILLKTEGLDINIGPEIIP